jgi:diacylglycerol O-acyltransferase / wax synthase
VTNVPGPQVPIYLLGARLLESYPHVPLADRLGLGIALLSYDGHMHWGFNADYDVVPDLADFVQDISASFRALRAVAGPIALRAAEPSRAAGRPRPAAAKKKRGRAGGPTASAG